MGRGAVGWIADSERTAFRIGNTSAISVVDQMLDALLEADEEAEGVVPRLPIHEEAGVERVHVASALEADAGVGRGAFVQFGAQSLEMIEVKVEISRRLCCRDAVGVHSFEHQLHERPPGPAERLLDR